ncbi:MAG: MopE-related protein [Myxococcota bacterium]
MKHFIFAALFCGLLIQAGCSEAVFEAPGVADRDGDGYTPLQGDCDDLNADVSPNAPEQCNGIDDNCSGLADEGVTTEFYIDSDGDGYGDNKVAATPRESCAPPAGYVTNNTDCDDSSPYVNKDAVEICDSQSIDHDCDGKLDAEDAVDRQKYYLDLDQDGFGDPKKTTLTCYQLEGYVEDSTDCNDGDASIHPTGEPETLEPDQCDRKDNNCDGDVDDPEIFDRDNDGTADCFAEEICDGLDNNLDGQVDEGFDLDGDGYTDSSRCSCKFQDGTCGKDCNDLNAADFPGGLEKCDGRDNDCDGEKDEFLPPDNIGTAPFWFVDSDGDDFGNPDVSNGIYRCERPTGFATNGYDCDDENIEVNPDEVERCNDIDDNCNAQTDEALPYNYYYVDIDGDSYGRDIYTNPPDDLDKDAVVLACRQPEGYVLVKKGDPFDCVDSNAEIFPSQLEKCNGYDDNCNDIIDGIDTENPTDYTVIEETEGKQLYYLDNDSDDFGDKQSFIYWCTMPPSYIEPPLAEIYFDCDDENDNTYPGASEQCDGEDNNCNTTIDDKVFYAFYFPDADDDKYGDFSKPGLLDCKEPEALDNYISIYLDPETNIWMIDVGAEDHPYTDDDVDCDDTDPDTHPYAQEYCDHEDDDCDGFEDEPDAVDAINFYLDNDIDGFGNQSQIKRACSYLRPMGYVEARTGFGSPYDCNDASPQTNPAAVEVVDNGNDDDCNGAELCYVDADNDNYRPNATATKSSPNLVCTDSGEAVKTDPATDCDDTNAQRNPSLTETCDGVDNDCDSVIDETDSADSQTWYQDFDGDGFGNVNVAIKSCYKPTGYVSNSTDCLDTNASVKPSGQEVCDANNLDEDCDGKSDDADSSASIATMTSYYIDADKDGYGKLNSSANKYCDNPSVPATQYSLVNTDCDDNDAFIYPGAKEVAGDNVDQDCDQKETCYVDVDNDNYRPNVTSTVVSSDSDCNDSGEAPSTDPAGDCNDADSSVNPRVSDTASDGIDNNCDGQELCYRDADSDGYRPNSSATILSTDLDCLDAGEAAGSIPTGDCNDNNALVSPAATELVSNEVDDNCDGKELCFVDGDNDDYRKGASFTVLSTNVSCDDSGEVDLVDLKGDDCNDASSSINPAATELVDTGVDENCDGKELCYLDADNDGQRPDSSSTIVSADLDCIDSAEAKSTDATTDCDDNNKSAYTGATEIVGNDVDESCDGKERCYVDADDDNYRKGASQLLTSADADCGDAGEVGSDYLGDDCDDTVATVKPGATEVVNNGKDDNCDGQELCYLDADDDGYRPDSTSTILSSDSDCTDPKEAVTADLTGDCNDQSSAFNPDATEVAGDGIDQNCNGTETCYKDADNDGYRPDTTSTVTSTDTDCLDSGEAYSFELSGDCNDASSSINPAAAEICNSVDDNCNSTIDENVKTTFYVDNDADTYGSPYSTSQACTKPSGYVTNNTDCNDSSASTYPGATETCNQKDDDCDLSVDEGVSTTYYTDGDGDTFGGSNSISSCSSLSGYVLVGGDCNDGDSAIKPGAVEICDSVDQDCDGTVDEGVTTVFYQDNDGDGYGSTVSQSKCTAPSGYVAQSGDCNDTLSSVNPGKTDYCLDTVDSDCDSTSPCLVETKTDSGERVVGTANDSRLGFSVVMGDVNNDGPADMIISAPGTAAGGTVYVYLGPITSSSTLATADVVLTGGSAGAECGLSLAVGDLAGDNKNDLAVGCPNAGFSGKVHIYTWDSSLTPPTLVLTVTLDKGTGPTEPLGNNSRFGSALHMGGDFDGDGFVDLAVGAPDANPSGVSLVYSKLVPNVVTPHTVASDAATFVAVSGFSSGSKFGHSVLLVENLVGDSKAELVVGAPDAVAGQGAVSIFTGIAIPSTPTPPTALTLSKDITAVTGVQAFGVSLVTLADFGTDSKPELVVGAPETSVSSKAAAGKVFVFESTVYSSTTITSTAAVASISGATAGGRLGTALASGASVDTGTSKDLLVSETFAATPLSSTPSDDGAVYAYLFATLKAGGALLTEDAYARIEPDVLTAGFGWSLYSAKIGTTSYAVIGAPLLTPSSGNVNGGFYSLPLGF